MILFTLCLVLLVFSPNYEWLLAALFGMGLALGCDYPSAHMVGAFGFQAIGALVGTGIGYLILMDNPALSA